MIVVISVVIGVVCMSLYTPVQRCYLQRRPEVQITSVQWHCRTPAPPTPTSVIIKPPTLSVSTCNILSLSLSLSRYEVRVAGETESGQQTAFTSLNISVLIELSLKEISVRNDRSEVIKAVRFEGT